MSINDVKGAGPHGQAFTGRPFTGRMLLAWLGGTFAVVFAVNITMVMIASDSQTGLVTDKPFEHGLMHNDILAEAARQKLLGWEVEGRIRQDGQSGSGQAVITATSRDGALLTGADVTVRLLRPADARLDRDLTVTPDGARWLARFDAVPPGLWQLEIAVTKGSDVFRLVRQVSIQ